MSRSIPVGFISLASGICKKNGCHVDMCSTFQMHHVFAIVPIMRSPTRTRALITGSADND